MIDSIRAIAEEAGRTILTFYGKVGSTSKADQSPLTQADLASHDLISNRLSRLHPSLPVLSEESEAADYSARQEWTSFWSVDPLDGTKEFLKQSGEFTVNIALIQHGEPVMGIVHSPVLQVSYWAERGRGAFRQQQGEPPQQIKVRKADRSRLNLVASRDHAGPEVAALLARFPQASTSSMGSSLKFCLVAEGKADVYLRDVPTMEWDTAAAQAIVEEAGGVVQELSGNRLRYNKPVLKNPAIITLGDPDFVWR